MQTSLVRFGRLASYHDLKPGGLFIRTVQGGALLCLRYQKVFDDLDLVLNAVGSVAGFKAPFPKVAGLQAFAGEWVTLIEEEVEIRPKSQGSGFELIQPQSSDFLTGQLLIPSEGSPRVRVKMSATERDTIDLDSGKTVKEEAKCLVVPSWELVVRHDERRETVLACISEQTES